MNELALFAGAGGGILGGHLLGWRTVCAVERDAYAAQVLAQRQNDGVLRPFPIWSDVCSFDGKPWRGIVDVVSGGFPCQDISVAGSGAGLQGARSGLWSEFKRIIGEVRPKYVLIENSPALITRGLDSVLSDLTSLWYDAEWMCLSASECGANHKRDRIWIVANDQGVRFNKGRLSIGKEKKVSNAGDSCKHEMGHSSSVRKLQQEGRKQNKRGRTCNTSKNVADPTGIGQQGQGESIVSMHSETSGEGGANKFISVRFSRKWPAEPRLGRVANGVAHRMDRLKALGNGQVPRVAATAFDLLS